MEKTQKDLLKEFQEEIARLKEQIETLEARLSSLQASPVQADDEEVDFTDIQIGVAEMPDQVGHDEPAPEPEAVPEPVVAPEPEPVVAPEPEPVVAPEAPKVSAPQPAEDDTAHLPWRTDKPGIPVKNIRSGISLLDRALFIGTLFKEDFALYDQTIADLNAMSNLDEAVAYIREKFPHWNLKSDVVYHFMMSVRKKLG